MATTAQSVLALYGALDRAVIETSDPAIAATVERYLPGSTGKNAGWYSQVLGFLGNIGPEFADQSPVPGLREALTTLQDRRELIGSDEPEALTTVQLSRMVYAIGALSHLPDTYRPDGLDTPLSELDEPFTGALAVAGGPDDSGLLDLLRSDFIDRAGFPPVMQFATRNGLIRSNVADVPLCRTRLYRVRGHLCVMLDTDFTSTKVSLDDVKNVVDPLNWAKCLSSFFCRMDKHDDRPDGWSRVLEHVSTTCAIEWTPRMVTPLKYWKGEEDKPLPQPHAPLRHPSAWLDFALEDSPLSGAEGDGRMVVDEGFIRMTSTVDDSTRNGVRVRTRKVAGFRNLAYVPAAIFACVMGYGDLGMEMLFDGVSKRPPGGANGWTDWRASSLPAAGDSSQPAPQPGQRPAESAPPGDEGDVSRRAVALAVDMVNQCVDDMSDKSAAIAAKWAAGAAPIAETATFGVELAERLATDPWRYLERLRGTGQGGAE